MTRILLALVLLAALAVPLSAYAESCTSSGSGRWTAVATGPWTGCTPDGTDTFSVASGHIVYVDGTIVVTTGSVTVASGGKLVVLPGSILQPGAFVATSAGGSLEVRGERLATCRIRSEVDWTAVDPVATLDCPAATIATTSDYLVFGEEDPAAGDFTRKAVVVGPGGPVPGAYKPSLNRYAWYDITALSGNAVTYDLDAGTYVASPDAPYAGTRGNNTTTAISSAQLSYTVQPGRRATLVTVALAYGSVVALHADRGSGYLYFVESAANAADPTYCSGRAAKILHTENGGAGDDLLYVAGDVSGCTNASARIIPGARRGDLVYLVRPATVDGIVTATHTGSVRIESGAALNVKLARFTRLGVTAAAAISPSLTRNCNICLYQSAGSPAATITGRFEDVDISFPEAETTDTGVFEVSSLATLTDYRYPNSGLLDLSGLSIKRLHIHDGRDEGTASGTHGIYLDGPKNVVIDGARLERLSDDLFGAAIAGNSTGSASDANSMSVRRILAYEGLAEDNNSQQGIEPSVIDDATPLGHNYVRQLSAITVRDSIAVGTYFEALSTNGHAGTVLDGVVSGGTFDANANRPGFNIQTTTGTGVAVSLSNAARVKNSLLTTYAEDGTSAVQDVLVTASLEDSVVWGDEQSADPGHRHNNLQGCYRSLIHHAGSTNFVLEGSSGSDVSFNPLREFVDCAYVNSATATRLAQNYNTGSTAYTLNFARFLYLQTAGWDATNGALGAVTFASGATVNVNGAVLSTGTPGTKNFDANAGGSVSDVCYESNNTAATDFQSYASATTLSVPDIYPDAASAPALGSLVGDPNSIDVCERAQPSELGLSRVGAAHVLLGDFAVEQMYPVYTSRKDLLQVAPPFAHPRGHRDF